jgi:alpha-methylacyl-CoA racemase
MESLGLGPEVCLRHRPSLVYTRATGWGQSGPLAGNAGHDINYTALSGALHVNGRAGQAPTPGAGLIGDFGGGGMLAAFGTLAAVLAARQTGRGQVVDAAASEGSALLATLLYGWRSAGLWHGDAGTNMGDGGAPFYDAYECADGRYIAVGAIEPQFWARLRERCGLSDAAFDAQWDRERWPELEQRMAALFRQRTRAQWCELLEGADACFAPVLDLDEAPAHPHHIARAAFASVGGITQPAPAPRFSATPSPACAPVVPEGLHTRALLSEFGVVPEDAQNLLAAGVAYAAESD